MPSIETRNLTHWQRPRLGTDGTTVYGLAIPYKLRSKPLGGWVEVIEPSFSKKNANDGFPGVTARFDGNWLIGTTPNTLRLTPVEQGVAMSIGVPQSLPFVCEYVERGDLQNVAVSWEVYEDNWTHEKGLPVRHLVSGRVRCVTLCVDEQPVDISAALASLARQFAEPVEYVADLAQRQQLWKLWGDDHAPKPQREPILLGKPGRQAYVEVVGAKENSAPVLDAYKVTATPADVAASKG